MSEPRLKRFACDGLSLFYREEKAGESAPFVFQHGLGGDHRQTFSLVRPRPADHQLTLDCRGHGESSLGDPADLSFCTYAHDLAGLLTSFGQRPLVLGGISMGASVALACAAAPHSRLDLSALVLVRPAWGTSPMAEPGRTLYKEIAELLQRKTPEQALRAFSMSDEFRMLEESAPAAAASLLGHFQDSRAAEMAEVYARLPDESPVCIRSLRRLRVPTLIVVTGRDPIHPVHIADELAAALGPAVTVVEVTSKSTDSERHQQEVEHVVHSFLDDVIW